MVEKREMAEKLFWIVGYGILQEILNVPRVFYFLCVCVCVHTQKKKHLIFMGQLIGLWSPLGDHLTKSPFVYAQEGTRRPLAPFTGRKIAVRSGVCFTQRRRTRNERNGEGREKGISIEGERYMYVVCSILRRQCDVQARTEVMCGLLR